MPSSARARGVAVSFVWALVMTIAANASSQTNYYSTNGTEYAIIGSVPGDQIFPDAAISATNGFVVWQDNATDGDGWGISARRLDSTLSGTLGNFRVNVNGAGDQERPRVAMFNNGGAAFVWQGGKLGFQHIYARFLNASNTFLSADDLLVSTATNNFQANPAVAVLTNGNLVVVWSGYNQAASNSMMDVYGQILSPTGAAVGPNFLVNQFISYNQRTPRVAGLKNGNFIVTWVSEQERAVAPNWGTNTTYTSASALSAPSVDIYARVFAANGSPVASEFLVNSDNFACANPDVAAATDGSYMIVWDEKNILAFTNSWDVYARPYSSSGAAGAVEVVNTHVYGDQYSPRISVIGLDYLVCWTSLGQDGSREGVFAQFIHNNGAPVGGELLVNTTTVGSQIQPVIASDGLNQFLSVWTSFTGVASGFDLFAQRYINGAAVLQPMSAPIVWAPFVLSNTVYQPQLVVSWPSLLGLSVSNFELYVDGASSPTVLLPSTANLWTMTAANGLTTNSTHSFRIDYVLNDGRRSPISAPGSGSTWSGQSWGGIPFEWMQAYYGPLSVSFPNGVPTYNWPSPNTPLAAGGPTLLQVFLSGGSPLDSSTWLHQWTVRTSRGMYLYWNTMPGAMYQVQSTAAFNANSWSNVGSPRFAAGVTDSIYVGGAPASFYRIQLLR